MGLNLPESEGKDWRMINDNLISKSRYARFEEELDSLPDELSDFAYEQEMRESKYKKFNDTCS